ncbi:hypothetical protein [Streptomyces sp. NPDC046887]|uniref:hypothetical protein n=1 Tax=Streptomyces sp. NPDC046887 TaxID=3155472 RepID=UPI0033C676E2
MSWDVLLLRLPEGITSMEDMGSDTTPPPLGPRPGVLASLRRAAPVVDLSDPSWGELGGPGWSMELNMGSDEPVGMIMLHIRGGGDDVLPVAFRIAAELDCRVFDCSAGELISAGDTSGWQAFQQYRDRVVE